MRACVQCMYLLWSTASYSTWWINNKFNLCLIIQHHAELFLGAMDTTFLLAYAVVSYVDRVLSIYFVWKRWNAVILVVSCYTPVNEEFMRSFIAQKERNAIMWHQSTRHGMGNNNWKKHLASGLKWYRYTHLFCNVVNRFCLPFEVFLLG